MAVHTCYPSTQEVEVGGSGVQGQPQLHSEFKAILGHMKSSQKKFLKFFFIIELITNTFFIATASVSLSIKRAWGCRLEACGTSE